MSEEHIVENNLWRNVREHLLIAGPVIFSFVMRKSVDIVSVVFVGHLGAHYLSAAGLASVTANVTGNSMIIGLSGPLSTLCSQANGAKDFKELCLVLQRAILIVCLFVCLPTTILWLFSESIMQLLGQTAEISKDASRYLTAFVPGLWAMGCSACIQNWLYSMAKTKALVWITLLLALFHPVICYTYIFQFHLGYIGAAYAVTTTKLLELILLLLYLTTFSTILKDVNFQFSRECLNNWWPYIKIGLPNMLMMSEWWASEIIIFLSGTLKDRPELQVGAMSVYQSLLSIAFMFPSGFRVSGETIVGNALGANNAHVAMTASYIAPALTFLVTVIIGIVLITNRRLWGGIFTADNEVISLVSSLMPICAVYVVLDALQASLTGVIKGMGKQRIGGPVVIFAYFIIGIPISAYLAFRKGLHWGIFGLCVGTLIGTLCHLLLYAYIVYCKTDWEHETRLVQDRNTTNSAKKQHVSPRSSRVVSSSSSDVKKGSLGSNMTYKSVSSVEEEDEESWWSSEPLSFFEPSITPSLSDQRAVEMVRTFTDALSPLHLNGEGSDSEEVEDFEFL